MSKTIIVSLIYDEPEWAETKQCIESSGLPVEYVSRDGVGNMARAFNTCFPPLAKYSDWLCKDFLSKVDYFWFVTNIIFDKDLPNKLVQAMDETGFAAIHPAMKTSDHRHQWPDGSGEVKEVPFVEWTAPMVRADVFLNNPLDEMLAYYYMDLSWCHEVKQQGYKVGVHHGVEINHTYLRNKQKPHPISEIRKQLRNYWTPISQQRMLDKYGKGWEQLMNWKP